MGVITVSRQYGSDGRTVGRKVANALGYRYIDKELIVHAATEAGTSISHVACFDEQPEHPVMRMLRKFLVSPHSGIPADLGGEMWSAGLAFPPFDESESPPALDEDACVKAIEKIMLRLVNEGNVVLIGRGGQACMGTHPGVLHVRVVAPMDFRVQTVMERDGLSEKEAAREVRKVDERRRLYLRRHYRIDWNRPELYHLVLNTGRIGVENAVRTIVENVRRLPLVRIGAVQG